MRRLIYIILSIIVLGLIFLVVNHFREQKKNNHITLYGNVDVRQVDLSFLDLGRVEKMFFEEGDFVPKGTLMALLEPQPFIDQVKQAEATVESNKRSLANAELILKRRREVVGSGAVSDEDYENALSSRDVLIADVKEAEAALRIALTNLGYIELYCPSDGTILTRIREPGTIVNISEPIYTLSVISPVWIRAYVDETDLGRIYYGMPANVYTDSGSSYTGKIGFISPVAEFTPKTVETTQLRTSLVYRLRIYIDNFDKFLKQGMPVTVKLIPEDKKN